MPPSPHNKKETPIPPPIDPKEIRQQTRLLIRHLSSVHDRDTPRQTAVIVNQIWHLVEYADLQLQRGEPAQALSMLQAVTDVCTTQGMHLNDFHNDVSTFFQDLASVWTEFLLTVDLTARERTRWTKQITTWQTRLTGWSNSTFFDAPQAALREGWDDVNLQQILQGTAPHPSVREGEISLSTLMLIDARLAVLERREQFQEYLRLARAEGQIPAYILMLVRQGQVAEAIDYGLQHLATAEDALALAQALVAQNEPVRGLQIAEHGLTLAGNLVPLASWLRDQAWSMGEHEVALKAGEAAFHGEPNLDQYLHVARIAGTHWPESRARLLELELTRFWSLLIPMYVLRRPPAWDTWHAFMEPSIVQPSFQLSRRIFQIPRLVEEPPMPWTTSRYLSKISRCNVMPTFSPIGEGQANRLDTRKRFEEEKKRGPL